MSDLANASEPRNPPTVSPRREHPQDDQEPIPRKKSRKSTIMEALRRELGQPSGPQPFRQMSTMAAVSMNKPAPVRRYLPRTQILDIIPPAPIVSPASLPIYTYRESLASSSLPGLRDSDVKYIRDEQEANDAIARMIDRLEPPLGSRWRGVVGFDMEWTVRGSPQKTGLVQVADSKTILLIQISAMESFPYKLKDLITSATILKVGVNIGADMIKLVRDFGSGCTARGVVELSGFAKALDIGLIGTAVGHLDSNQASIGIGVRSNDTTSSASANRSGETPDLSGEDFIPDEDITGISKSKGKSSAIKYVRPKGIIALARLARRYLGRELDKGPVRLSNWDKILSADQKYYAANDAHAGLAIYHALLAIYSRSVAQGVIPVPIPPPWDVTPTTGTLDSHPLPKLRPAPPPFGSKTKNNTSEVMPVDRLQRLTPLQIESLIPWAELIRDMHAELLEVRTAVRAKRIEEGVDLKGRGEAVIVAEAAAVASTSPIAATKGVVVIEDEAFIEDATTIEGATTTEDAAIAEDTSITDDTIVIEDTVVIEDAIFIEKTDEPMLTVSQDDAKPKVAKAQPAARVPSRPASASPAATSRRATPIGTTSYRPNSTTVAISKGMVRVLAKRRALQEKDSEVFGQKWPPTRTPNTRPAAALWPSSVPTSSLAPRSISETRNPLGGNHYPQISQPSTRPQTPVRSVSSTTPDATSRPSAQQLRAYLLWHNQKFPLSQICISMGSARYPLAKNIVIGYIIQALQADESLPFEKFKLKALVESDLTNSIQEKYKEFLDSKVGLQNVESQ